MPPMMPDGAARGVPQRANRSAAAELDTSDIARAGTEFFRNPKHVTLIPPLPQGIPQRESDAAMLNLPEHQCTSLMSSVEQDDTILAKAVALSHIMPESRETIMEQSEEVRRLVIEQLLVWQDDKLMTQYHKRTYTSRQGNLPRQRQVARTVIPFHRTGCRQGQGLLLHSQDLGPRVSEPRRACSSNFRERMLHLYFSLQSV